MFSPSPILVSVQQRKVMSKNKVFILVIPSMDVTTAAGIPFYTAKHASSPAYHLPNDEPRRRSVASTTVGGKTPGRAKDRKQLAQDRLARGKGRLRSSRLEPWPAALGAGWSKVHAGLVIAVCAVVGPASTCHIRLGLSLP
jgi:hypothetical protein